ncbi:hypothetical protein [Flaviaesturariibacter amylovorans]|uniref:hypothetical protein n=1 Tax=Flaviaesturariibacter amylovorans TaxID=1084520 RepID=UPI0031EA060D
MASPNPVFSARNDRLQYSLPVVISAIPIVGLTYAFLKDPAGESAGFRENPGLIVFIGFLLLVLGYFCYQMLDKREKLVVEPTGIWTSKYKRIDWEQVSSLAFQSATGRYGGTRLIIGLRASGRELRFDVSGLDRTPEEIRCALKAHSAGFDIAFPDEATEVAS